MAARDSRPALTFEQLETLAAHPPSPKVLTTLILIASAGDPAEEAKILCHLIRCRASGFLVVAPATEYVAAFLDLLGSSDDRGEIITHEVSLALEDSRGRKFGTGTVLLVDLPADYAGAFLRAGGLRGAALVGLHRINVDGTVARPAAKAAWNAAALWISEMAAGDETIQEYLTAESGLEADAEELLPDAGADQEAVEQTDLVAQLQARIQELESQVTTTPALQPQADAFVQPRPKAPPTRLFPAGVGQEQLDPTVLERLKALAGPPPRRLSKMDASQPPRGPAASAAQHAAAEVDTGALELEALGQIAETVDDPLHRLLALQMQQNALVVQKLVSQNKNAPDRISAALGSKSGSSSSGVKGCVARDAYIKTMEDVISTGHSIMLCAASDLGIPEDQIHSGLLRDYMERRMPLGDHRMLSYLSQFFAVGWQLSFEENNQFAMGLLARGLMMAEQIALDSGRCQFAWLLSAMPEPNLQAISQNKRRIGLKPYSKLAAAPWVAGNIAYLKDLDYLENRLKPSTTKTSADASLEEATDPKPPKKWKNRQKGKGKEETSDTTA